MAQEKRYLFQGRISERKFRDRLRPFALDITADRAAALVGVNHKTAAAFYTLLHLRMAELARAGCPFRGQVGIDESTFGPPRQRGRPGLGRGRAWRARCRASASSNVVGGCIARS